MRFDASKRPEMRSEVVWKRKGDLKGGTTANTDDCSGTNGVFTHWNKSERQTWSQDRLETENGALCIKALIGTATDNGNRSQVDFHCLDRNHNV